MFYSQHGEDKLIEHFFPNNNNGICIEVGAYDGSDSLKYHNNGYIVYTFEPKKDLFNNLKNKVTDFIR